jgi:hypothetical protein
LIFLAACLATLIGVLYAIENWRGQRAWDRVRTELAAKGARLDWAHFIPAPLSDEQNIFKAPYMEEWFVKGQGGSNSLGQRLSEKMSDLPLHNASQTTELLVAVIKIVRPASRPSDAVVRFNDPKAREQIRKLIQTTIGPTLRGARGFTLVARPLDEIKPVDLVVEADPAPTVQQMSALLPSLPSFTPTNSCKVVPIAEDTFRVVVMSPASWCTASEYLIWGQQFEPDFEIVREALKRPFARMDGDYELPFASPIPNFVAIRNLVQVLGQRAQANLLLGQSKLAAQDLLLVQDLCRIMEVGPTAKPMTLVATMVHAAVSGMYAGVIQDGWTLEAWQESELKALQAETTKIHLLPLLVGAFEAERAAIVHLLANTKPSELAKVFSLQEPTANWWRKVSEPTRLLVFAAPRGWASQNLAVMAELEQKIIESFDPAHQIVFPTRVEAATHAADDALTGILPYTFLARRGLPNFLKASASLARHQALASQVIVACALERYRLAKGQYPETLDALVPLFIQHLPLDVIGGTPLKYRRTEEGRFLLYSIGWNERDDGGATLEKTMEGDWVWGGA